jgi:hypothetical protein
MGFSTRVDDQSDSFIRPILVQIEDCNLRTFCAEPLANCTADTAAASGYDDTFSTQASHICVLFLRCTF